MPKKINVRLEVEIISKFLLTPRCNCILGLIRTEITNGKQLKNYITHIYRFSGLHRLTHNHHRLSERKHPIAMTVIIYIVA